MKIGYFPYAMNFDINSHAPTPDQAPKSNPPKQELSLFGNENKSLISLAVKCRLISLDQERALLDILAKKRQETPEYTAKELFHETNDLSVEDITFLYAVRDHLETKMLDKKFGELGVANQIVPAKSVKKALDIQSAIFKETNESKLIGDILLENKEITRADKTAILLTQDRIKDELLSEAMNDIAASEIEKLSLNMRFGAIAVKKQFITIDQLNQALAEQKAEVSQGEPRRYLGDILKQLFNLSDNNLHHILKIQKELEKKRLALEQALEKYNSEININKRLAKIFEYRFSKNKLNAFLRQSKQGYEDIQVPALKAWLNSIGINFGVCPDRSIKTFLNKNKPGTEIQIANGRAPIQGKDGNLEFYFDTQLLSSEATDEPDVLPLVKKGDALAKMIPAQEGRPGKDVSGFILPTAVPKTAGLNCGKGVIRNQNLFLANTDGMAVLYQNRTLFVRARETSVPTKHYTGSIDMDIGERYKSVNLKVDGSILENGMVRCQNLEVDGHIWGQVSAAGNIIVKGDIGQLLKGNHKTPDTEPAKIKAEGDILAGKTIANAIIVTAKSLKAPKSGLVASAVQAFQDIVLNEIQNTGPRPCLLQTGKAPNLKADSINGLIQSRTDQLNQLRCTDETRELEQWLQGKLKIKEDFLSQQEYLKYVLEVIQCRALSGLPNLSDRLLAAKKNPDKCPDLPDRPPEMTASLAKFKKEFLQATQVMDQDALKTHTRNAMDIKYGMYRAAVNATRRYSLEYEARKKIILGKIVANQDDIEKMEATIRKLTIRKDTFLLGQAYKAQPVPPAIKVKNRVAQGTGIKGRKARLTIDQDIYGVKSTETIPTNGDAPEILIEGLYE